MKKKIIIVGGGIVGNLLHLMLESKEFSIYHFEKKINYSMSTKNKKKILEIGDEILKKNLLCINSLIK